MKLEPIIQLPGAWTGISGGFGVHFFEGSITVADMDQMQATGDDWRRRNPGKFVELVVVLPSAARMTTEERRRMTELIKRTEDTRDASATVILADGLVGSIQRSVLTAILMLAPPPHPSKIFDSVGEAVTWLFPYLRQLCRGATSRDVAFASVEALGAAFRSR